ncbi:MAG: hypothetical protein PF442_05740 [Desulfobulbaceae bacterium]|jgi:CHASE3 domain sensor protein|nr:hypothetical protein [Desulfobulbaceae bacterium]
MGQLRKETWIVIKEFQKYVKGEDSIADSFSLEEIRKADEEIGVRDENQGFRLAMRNRIQDLEEASETKKSKTEQSYIRTWVLITGILGAILTGIILKWIL